MRSGTVKMLGREAGHLEETAGGYCFTYFDQYLADPMAPPVSLTLPKRLAPYQSETLFPFFAGLLAEGSLKTEQCRRLGIDEEDAFGRLLLTAGNDTIGAVTVHPESA
ncbi:MAG: HipA N-terminal domain-containing protein [Verrucomicrobia bacterium]|nr:HipA N-terminal domain-containing protein [Verrucomicrobiota bacterium]MCH8512249.1 HipA N-terminal domain-containing protein [Kiritimatiellia bacterium]